MRYAAIEKTTSSHWVEGDQRSRDCPGHGYPEGWETTISLSLHEFDTADQLTSWLERQRGFSNKEYRLIQFEELKAETTISVQVVPR